MDNKLIIQRLFNEVLNKGNLTILEEIIAEEYIDHNPSSNFTPGAEGIKLKVRSLRDAFPDIMFVLEDLIAEGMLVAARYHWRGTHKGPFANILPTDNLVEVTGMDLYRIENGKIIEHWHNIDELGLLHQLGVINC